MISLVVRAVKVRQDLKRLRLIDELFERVNEADPCHIPDCQHIRAEIHHLSRQKALGSS